MKISRLVIGSRRSALARLQAYHVATELKKAYPTLEIEFLFKESLGDKNLDSPLWQMPEKGVFTKDLQHDLIAGHCDLVVHSWKDLPVELPPETELVATLKRADARDVLLLKNIDFKTLHNQNLELLSSSPRRAYNLARLLPRLLPFKPSQINFESIRGNVPTRVRKLLENPKAQGLILAKAALDRLLAPCPYPDQEVEDFQNQLRNDLKNLRWMVLPLSENPTAPAQGALAIEICKNKTDLKELLMAIHHPHVFEAVTQERVVLKKYGGGCHQKIGASVFSSPHNEESLLFLRGEAESGEALLHSGAWSQWKDSFESKSNNDKQSLNTVQLWPAPNEKPNVFERVPLAYREGLEKFLKQSQEQNKTPLLTISRHNALPENCVLPQSVFVWTAGIKTWEELARKSIWVHGTHDSLGESNLTEELVSLIPELNVLRLSHDEVHREDSPYPVLATYSLKMRDEVVWPKWEKLQECYWMSSSLFEAALKADPQLLNKVASHACGAGFTAEHLKKKFEVLKSTHKHLKLKIYLGHEEWWKSKAITAKN